MKRIVPVTTDNAADPNRDTRPENTPGAAAPG
jgi:hypothetical protein